VTTARILFVEDDPDDQELLRLATRKVDPDRRFDFADTGQEAVAYLHGDANTSSIRLGAPTLIFTDLEMPGMDGFALIEAIRADEDLFATPIVALTTSEARRDIDRAYLLGCNAYHVKPLSLGELTLALGQILDYWLRVSRLPGGLIGLHHGDDLAGRRRRG
jgi:CheY-like chemotaxis protein